MRRMSLRSHLNAILAPLRRRATDKILAHRVRARHPTLTSHPTAIWDYGYRDLDMIEIGQNVLIEPYAFILVYKKSPFSDVPGRLILEDRAGIGYGTNIRAAGGTIRIGSGSAVAQNCVLIAANHAIKAGEARLHVRWDEENTGVDIGSNVWIGAGCVILPGSVIEDNAVIAAGSLVHKRVPAGELWGGWPARKIRTIEKDEVAAADVDSAARPIPSRHANL
jgi:acetyltransferase-like isoleucine patch superfamily enzyme